MRTFKILIIFLIFVANGCGEFKNKRQNQLVARVDNNYLYMTDIDNLRIKFSSYSDSIVQVQNFINSWAKNHLLFDKAILNIRAKNKISLNKLVEQYRLDLFNNSYKSSIIKAQIDTLITKQQLLEYYRVNSSVFLLKEPLYRYRFIELPKNNIDRKEIKKRFTRFSNLDKIFLDSLSYQFSNSFLNDSLWFKKNEIIKNAPFFSSKKFLTLKKSQIFELEDSIQVYLFKIEDDLLKNEIAPLSSVENTIRNIVFNQRKLEFLKKFDKEIINDAIQNKKFEIYK